MYTVYLDSVPDNNLKFDSEISAFWYLWDTYIESNKIDNLETYVTLLEMFRTTHSLPDFGYYSIDN